jgi:hypothetical protein
MSNAERYTLLLHKMQAGVRFDQETDPERAVNLRNDGIHLTPELSRHLKHERTGINAGRVDIGALTKLLIERGVFTEEEWWKAACEMMQAEVERYEQLLSARLGRPVTLDTPFIDPVTGRRRV